MKIYQALASKLNAASNCIASNNTEWQEKHEAAIDQIMKDTSPSGSGIDCGTKFNVDDNLKNPAKLIFTCEFHHMDENGGYDGWTSHVLTVTPCLQFGFKLKISGPNRNQIKEYLHEVYSLWLNQDI